MTLNLHHIFVCTSVGAPEAQTLLDAGLVEGSGNIHPGQGTANRRFFFDRGYLELLWVHDKVEARAELTAPTRLWDRWVERGQTTNPFGLCLSSSSGLDDNLAFPTWTYQPDYLPARRSILFADNQPLTEPEIFILDWPQDQSSPATEPTNHPLGLIELQCVSIGMPAPGSNSESLDALRDAGVLAVHISDSPELVIKFRSRQEVQLSLPELGLCLVGHSGNGP